MPDATIRNNTQDIINVGFWVGAPCAFQNEVGVGQTARVHLPSLPLTVEVRIDNGSNRFSTGESWKKGGELVTACAAGTAAVVAGSMWLLGMFGPRASPTGTAAVAGAGLAWRAANDAGARFGQPASGSILFVDRVAILFEEKHFSVRWNGRHELWDDDANKLLGN